MQGVRIVQAILVVEVAAFLLSTVPGVRSGEGFDPLIDGWLQGAAYVTTAVLCVLRPVLVKAERAVWSWLAAALVMRALAFVAYLGFIREMDPIPYPSIADFGWLAMDAFVLVAIVTLVRSRFTRVTRSLVIDGLVGALATTAIALALLYGTLVDLTAAGTPNDVVATNLAYPIADISLMLVILGALVAFNWRPPIAVWILGAAIASFAVVDSVFLYQVTAGTYQPGSPIAGLSLVATAGIAWAAWIRPAREYAAPAPRPDVVPGLVVPAIFGLACVGLLVYASREDVPIAAVGLAAAGLVVGTVRAALTFHDYQSLSADLRRQTEVVRAALEEAERANRSKGEYLSGVSHELRTPLNSVVGFAQLIELDAEGEQRRNAERIVAAGRHLVAMIDDLLDMSRLEHGPGPASVDPVPAGEAVREAIEMAEPLIAEAPITLESRVDEGADRWVRADGRRLRQVLINLISNAVKYNREDGRVTVSILAPRPGAVRFAVADTGVGIAPADLPRIFDPFERLGADRGPKAGTGLGLAVSKGLVEEMGGSIDVKSEPGVGTTFHVDLPEAQAPGNP